LLFEFFKIKLSVFVKAMGKVLFKDGKMCVGNADVAGGVLHFCSIFVQG
jgi:hypothetical protein